MPAPTDAGYTYDAWGRTTTVPAVAAGGRGLTNSYYSNDLVAGQTHGPLSKTYLLDPGHRLHKTTDTTGTTQINHYSGDNDSPSWTDEGNHS